MNKFTKAIVAIMLMVAVVSAAGCKKAKLPTVETNQVSNLTTTQAAVGGFITSDGGSEIIERGICWGKNTNPEVSTNVINAGQGVGSFTCTITGLEPSTTYYARAYAVNSVGVGYGAQVSFTTLSNGGGGGGGETPENYTVSVSAAPTEGGTVSGGGTFQQGQQCTVKATANPGYSFVNWTENNNVVSNNVEYTFTVNGNHSFVANFSANGGSNVPAGAINGSFSVNASGYQVYFSQGNLQYIGSVGTPYWKFANNQWEYLGTTTGQDSDSRYVDRDVFGWGTSGYNHGATYYQPWATTNDHYGYYAYGVENYNLYDSNGQADWGYNAISNGGNGVGLWRTLTFAEWKYVFDNRDTPSGIRFAHARIMVGGGESVNGVLLLPDDWVASYYTLNNPNASSGANYSDNVITAVQWAELEQHGVVFLPAAGQRNAGTTFLNAGSNGFYWSATCYSFSTANVLVFGLGYVDLNPNSNYSRYQGCSVRLVCPAQ